MESLGNLSRPMADPALGEILVQRDDLAHRVKELGEEVSRDYAGRKLLLIGVLKGAIFFLADLMRNLEVDCELDFMAVSSYGASTDSSVASLDRFRLVILEWRDCS